ncbi:hypothetical protein AAFC00_002531 [Neodothiora populina]|uniref:PNK3P-domain-containing protein n=1 Tax=Neodothiora populina TaxID=2781224 RepID=A0ABR3P8R0_9PEZI
MSPSLKRRATEDGSVSPPPTKRTLIQATTTNSAIANFFKPASQKEPDKTTWRVVDNSLLVCNFDKVDEFASEKPRKVALFDFDSTLITSASGKKFAQAAEDWKWWHPHVPTKLQQMVADGYLVAIISNQGGISLNTKSKTVKSDQKRLVNFKQKVKAVLNQLDLPVSLYAATEKDRYRKPRVGMWENLLQDQALQLANIDMQASVFVGDAGGRTASGMYKADFACSDRDLASNIGIRFSTPEEFFLDEEVRPFARVFDPSIVLATKGSYKSLTPILNFASKNPLNVIVFCGSPGAGKSTFFWKHLEPLGYERINQDKLGSRRACMQAAEHSLAQGKPVAIDNTNADIDTRAHWVDLASRFKIPTHCVLFTASARLCEHNDAVRSLGGSSMNPEARLGLPKVAFTSFASRYRAPTLKEGFEGITEVDFEFAGTEEQTELWSKFWI